LDRKVDFKGAWLAVFAMLLMLVSPAEGRAADPLPSWNEGATKSAITSFVERVTQENSPDFVPPSERIAVFDNDGTLWPENPRSPAWWPNSHP